MTRNCGCKDKGRHRKGCPSKTTTRKPDNGKTIKDLERQAMGDVRDFDDLRIPLEYIDRGVVHHAVRCFYCSSIIAVALTKLPPVACIDCVLNRPRSPRQKNNGKKVEKLFLSE